MTSMTPVLQNLGGQFPLLLVYLLGIALAIMQMQRLPRVALPAVAGLGLLLLVQLVQPLLGSAVVRAMRDNPQQISLVYMLLNFVVSLLKAVGTGALIYAIFADRPFVAAAVMNPWETAGPITR